MTKRKIEFQPVVVAGVKIHLSIDVDKPGFSVWVGGCCVGSAKTLVRAKEILIERACAILKRHHDDAYSKAKEYATALVLLEEYGVRKMRKATR